MSTTRSVGALCVAATLVVATVALVSAQAPAADCTRTPQVQSADAVGVTMPRIREYLAQQYATQPRYVSPVPDGADAYELTVSDVGGDHELGRVRVERAPRGGGWLIMTANTCGD